MVYAGLRGRKTGRGFYNDEPSVATVVLKGLMRERKDKIKNFLSRFFRNHELGDDDDIFAMGFVNSLLALQLVNFLQKEFSITVEDEDLDFENFRTINNMDALLGRKLAAPVETDRATA